MKLLQPIGVDDPASSEEYVRQRSDEDRQFDVFFDELRQERMNDAASNGAAFECDVRHYALPGVMK